MIHCASPIKASTAMPLALHLVTKDSHTGFPMSRSMSAWTVVIPFSGDVTTDRKVGRDVLSWMRSDSQSQRARFSVDVVSRVKREERAGAASARRRVHWCIFKRVAMQNTA